MLSKKYTVILKNSNNLLAFSSGVDSTALFFILLKNRIDFDIAIVNYNLRKESNSELNYAKELAKKFNKKIFIKDVKVDFNNFEANAREIRYKFFKEIIKENSYKNLITAHQLNDKLEWFLMQLTKGAGLVELFGLKDIIKKENYIIIRPLLKYSKYELKKFLDERDIKYFIDNSNFNYKYKRNYFRGEFANRLIDEFKSGIKNSFDYLEVDVKSLEEESVVFQKYNFFILKNLTNEVKNIRAIDKILKQLGVLISKSQRDEILKTKDCVISGIIAISYFNDKIYIAPYLKIKLDKKFKEWCRVKRIPPKVRGYLKSISFNLL